MKSAKYTTRLLSIAVSALSRTHGPKKGQPKTPDDVCTGGSREPRSLSLNLYILARLHRKHRAYLKRSRVRFLGLEPVLGVYGGDLKNAPTVGIEPVTSRSRGGHHIHYTTATNYAPLMADVEASGFPKQTMHRLPIATLRIKTFFGDCKC
ncbi:hypothetical protein DPMN_036127 [Dreissena polymorpha]|uniref:Uncharacterized protein n=1 Tax=Dreissena polymorpha TaxID=45954 RepID=A0A9D4MC00_DREPO|nr:hypothetical protein DPMN_036127 [Dreissena polymorpha]